MPSRHARERQSCNCVKLYTRRNKVRTYSAEHDQVGPTAALIPASVAPRRLRRSRLHNSTHFCPAHMHTRSTRWHLPQLSCQRVVALKVARALQQRTAPGDWAGLDPAYVVAQRLVVALRRCAQRDPLAGSVSGPSESAHLVQ